jgi:rare lipoprotein A
MLVMDRKNQSSGQTKSRGFTNMVNVHRIRPIVSMALAEYYSVFARSTSACPRTTVVPAGPFLIRTIQYWIDSASRRLRQRGLPGLAAAAALFTLMHSGAHAPQPVAAKKPEVWVNETGTASYYGRGLEGRRTAAGTRFDPNELTAAHPWLPFGSRVSVTLQGTGRSVVVTITDRLYSARRVIDLSMAAARLLGMVHQGVGTVLLEPA